MPEVSRFYAIYAEHEALIEIESGRIHQGSLPRIALELVNKWRLIHLHELRENWNRARQNESVLPIEPLE